MHTLVRYCLYISLVFTALPARADIDIAGVQVPGSYSLAGQSLVLNGAGIRSKFFIKVYVGALYLGSKTSSVEQVLAAPGPKSMQMMMLYKEVSAEKIADGWTDGFRENLSADRMASLRDRLEQFNGWFPALKKGDHVTMDYVPGEGTTLKINDAVRGRIEGADFFEALLKVWLGDHPADKGLKRGLLGG